MTAIIMVVATVGLSLLLAARHPVHTPDARVGLYAGAALALTAALAMLVAQVTAA